MLRPISVMIALAMLISVMPSAEAGNAVLYSQSVPQYEAYFGGAQNPPLNMTFMFVIQPFVVMDDVTLTGISVYLSKANKPTLGNITVVLTNDQYDTLLVTNISSSSIPMIPTWITIPSSSGLALVSGVKYILTISSFPTSMGAYSFFYRYVEGYDSNDVFASPLYYDERNYIVNPARPYEAYNQDNQSRNVLCFTLYTDKPEPEGFTMNNHTIGLIFVIFGVGIIIANTILEIKNAPSRKKLSKKEALKVSDRKLFLIMVCVIVTAIGALLITLAKLDALG